MGKDRRKMIYLAQKKWAYLYSHVKALCSKSFSACGIPFVILSEGRSNTNNKPKHCHASCIIPNGKNTHIAYPKNIYFASIGLIGIPGTIDNVEEENSMPLFMREGTTRSCLQLIKQVLHFQMVIVTYTSQISSKFITRKEYTKEQLYRVCRSILYCIQAYE